MAQNTNLSPKLAQSDSIPLGQERMILLPSLALPWSRIEISLGQSTIDGSKFPLSNWNNKPITALRWAQQTGKRIMVKRLLPSQIGAEFLPRPYLGALWPEWQTQWLTKLILSQPESQSTVHRSNVYLQKTNPKHHLKQRPKQTKPSLSNYPVKSLPPLTSIKSIQPCRVEKREIILFHPQITTKTS